MHGFIGGHFPAHRDLERIEAHQPRPENDARRAWIAGRDAERERVRIEADLAIGGAGWKRLRNTKRCESLQEPAAADHGASISGPCFRGPTRNPARSSTARGCTRPSSATSRSYRASIGWHSFALTSQTGRRDRSLPLLRSQQRMLHNAVRHGLPVSQREDRLPPQPEIELHDHVTVVAGHPPGAG